MRRRRRKKTEKSGRNRLRLVFLLRCGIGGQLRRHPPPKKKKNPNHCVSQLVRSGSDGPAISPRPPPPPFNSKTNTLSLQRTPALGLRLSLLAPGHLSFSSSLARLFFPLCFTRRCHLSVYVLLAPPPPPIPAMGPCPFHNSWSCSLRLGRPCPRVNLCFSEARSPRGFVVVVGDGGDAGGGDTPARSSPPTSG